MNLNALAVASFIALIFGGWALAGHYSKAGGWLGTLVFTGTTLVVVSASIIQGQLSTGMLSRRAIVLLGIYGLLHGLAVFAYSQAVTDPKISAGLFSLTVSILSVISTAGLWWLATRTLPTLQQGFGVILGILAIYLLNKPR